MHVNGHVNLNSITKAWLGMAIWMTICTIIAQIMQQNTQVKDACVLRSVQVLFT
jgi:hypothetical protein